MVLRERTEYDGVVHTRKGLEDKTPYVIFRARLMRVHLAERFVPRRRRPEF
jgi:hypothetical protein